MDVLPSAARAVTDPSHSLLLLLLVNSRSFAEVAATKLSALQPRCLSAPEYCSKSDHSSNGGANASTCAQQQQQQQPACSQWRPYRALQTNDLFFLNVCSG